MDRVSSRAHDAQEMYLASTSIGAALGAYAGALPIPLDWDRPWQVSVWQPQDHNATVALT